MKIDDEFRILMNIRFHIILHITHRTSCQEKKGGHSEEEKKKKQGELSHL